MRELFHEEKTLIDALDVLEYGKDAPRKRKVGTIERWLYRGNKIYNAVVVADYNESLKEHVWVLIHFGKFSRK